MNLVVGFMLIISGGNELDTFYMLVSNFSETFIKRKAYEYSFRGLFSEEFPLLYFLNFIFDILLEDNIPEVKNHLEELGISYDLWIGQWFQTLFTIILPLNMCKRVWDCIFSDNIYFLVKFGIAFTKLIKNEILEKTEEIDVINFFKELQKFSMYPDNKFLESKCDIDTLITKASKIKLDPEEYIKLYRRRNENYGGFKSMMDKNSKILFPLEIGNTAWNDFKLINRNTILFEKGENDIEKEKGNDKEKLDQIKELYGEDFKENENIIEDEKIKNNINNINNENKIKQNEIIINDNQINDENENEIKIKPILQRKNNINTSKKLFVPKKGLFDFDKNDNNLDNSFDNKKGEKNNNKIKKSNNVMPTYEKKKMNQINFNKDKNTDKNKNNIDNNMNYDNNKNNNINNDNNKFINNNNYNNINNFNMINDNNNNGINYNISNNFNDYNDRINKYYNVNLSKDNKNLDRYYFNKN